jgi:hypothetical protein
VNTHTRTWRQIYDLIAPGLALLCLVIALVAAVGTYFNDRAVTSSNTERIQDNTTNAITNCENANETREASRTLWNFVLDLSLARKDGSPERVAYLEEFRTWIGEVYAERDCEDLSREYPLPPPPALPQEGLGE